VLTRKRFCKSAHSLAFFFVFPAQPQFPDALYPSFLRTVFFRNPQFLRFPKPGPTKPFPFSIAIRVHVAGLSSKRPRPTSLSSSGFSFWTSSLADFDPLATARCFLTKNVRFVTSGPADLLPPVTSGFRLPSRAGEAPPPMDSSTIDFLADFFHLISPLSFPGCGQVLYPVPAAVLFVLLRKPTLIPPRPSLVSAELVLLSSRFPFLSEASFSFMNREF